MARARWRLGWAAAGLAALAAHGTAAAQEVPDPDAPFTWSLVSRFAGYEHDPKLRTNGDELVGVQRGTSARLRLTRCSWIRRGRSAAPATKPSGS